MKTLKNKKRPYETEGIEEALTDTCSTASSGDMTGLIPSGDNDSQQLDAYNDMYPYLADGIE